MAGKSCDKRPISHSATAFLATAQLATPRLAEDFANRQTRQNRERRPSDSAQEPAFSVLFGDVRQVRSRVRWTPARRWQWTRGSCGVRLSPVKLGHGKAENCWSVKVPKYFSQTLDTGSALRRITHLAARIASLQLFFDNLVATFRVLARDCAYRPMNGVPRPGRQRWFQAIS